MVVSCLNIHTSTVRQDIDQAAKYIGAGAATVGVAGSGNCLFSHSEPVCNACETLAWVRSMKTKFVGRIENGKIVFAVCIFTL